MTPIATSTLEDGAVAVEIDEAAHPRGAVYAAAFTFIDRCWVHLDRAGEGRLRATLRPKAGGGSAEALAAELQDELLGEAWRQQIEAENRALVERVTLAALGAPGAEGAAAPVDDLLAAEGDFEDPLGIALSWEEKYADKNTPLDPAAASIDDGGRKLPEPGA